MNGKFALVIHPDEEVRQQAGAALSGAGMKVMTASTDGEALERLGNLSFMVPDVLLTPLDSARPLGSEFLARLRNNPLTESLPVVVLGSGDDESRRRALRLGLSHVVPPPFDSEDLLLNCRLALEKHRDERLLSGSLEQFSVTDLLQTAEASRRSGTVVLKSRGLRATLWLQGGRIIDAETSDGLRGKEAVFASALWDGGNFEADFSPISVPERIQESTSYLLLEAMRLKDESGREEGPLPHAAIPDPPPLPERSILATHRGLTLVNITAAYAVNHLTEPLLEQRLDRCRHALLAAHPLLDHFIIGEQGRVSLSMNREFLARLDVEAFVRAVAVWLSAFFDEMEHALPGRFPRRRLRALSEAIQEDLEDLGFYRELGLEPSTSPEERP